MESEKPKIEQAGQAGEDRIPGIPQYAVKYIRSGEIGPVYFHGQTVVIIPWEKYQRIGKDKIIEIAGRLYGKEAMERDIRHFSGEADNYYYHLELPPKQTELLEKLLEELNRTAT